jgi:deazaflavin-dependent oxidoreductase (nitroreductase family)
MSDQLFSLSLPHGILKWLLRLPIGLYHAHLGSLLGDRFLMLTHVGRKTGQLHQTVVEVVQHDPATDTYYVVSGWGERANWYRNILAHPQVTIQVRNQKLMAIADRVSPNEGGQIMMDYARKHPFALRELARIMKYPLDGSEASANNLGRIIPIIAFRTRPG